MDDDLLTVRRVLHSGPPSPEATARARDLLTAELAGAPRPAGAVRTPSPRTGWTGRGALLAGGLAALILAGVFAAPAFDRPDHDEPGARTPGTAQDLLLAAAEKAADAPATSGRYWHVRQIAVGGPIRVGPYDVAGRWLREWWVPASGGKAWWGELPLGYRPRTAADEDAWRAAGSPTSWTVGPATFASTPEEPHLSQEDTAGKPFRIYADRYDVAGIAALPTDPAELRARIMAGRPVPPPYADRVACQALAELLFKAPAPPALRAAAFTAMSGIPGMRSIGTVTTADGRSGTGIELVVDPGDGKASRHVTVIDPKTYQVLAVEDSGSPEDFSTVAVLQAGWTDTEPTLPRDDAGRAPGR